MSAFEKWFVKQHGPRKTTGETDDKLRDLITAGKRAELELHRRREWDARQQSALYAWTVNRGP